MATMFVRTECVLDCLAFTREEYVLNQSFSSPSSAETLDRCYSLESEYYELFAKRPRILDAIESDMNLVDREDSCVLAGFDVNSTCEMIYSHVMRSGLGNALQVTLRFLQTMQNDFRHTTQRDEAFLRQENKDV